MTLVINFFPSFPSAFKLCASLAPRNIGLARSLGNLQNRKLCVDLFLFVAIAGSLAGEFAGTTRIISAAICSRAWCISTPGAPILFRWPSSSREGGPGWSRPVFLLAQGPPGWGREKERGFGDLETGAEGEAAEGEGAYGDGVWSGQCSFLKNGLKIAS